MALVVGFIIFAVVGGEIGVAALAIGAVIELGELYLWTRYLSRFRVKTGVEALVGEHGWTTSECRPAGMVRVRGELWQATCEEPDGLPEGAEIEVTAVEGLRVKVRALARD